MCARYTLIAEIPVIAETLGIQKIAVEFLPRYNIAPTQQVPAIVHDGVTTLKSFRWGLAPSWAKDLSFGRKLINARAETLREKPSFRNAFKKQRCLIPADGFYEWRKDGAVKTPVYIYMKSRKPFAFAGLYETWRSPEGDIIPTCTIITTEPNAFIQPVHNRMPVILPNAVFADWLDPSNTDTKALQQMLVPVCSEDMAMHEVSRTVNSPLNDMPECIAP